METAIERLRASKQESAQSDQLKGKEHGREWAENDATYDDLRRVANRDEPEDSAEGGSLRAMARAG
jgi:hypothetical protein